MMLGKNLKYIRKEHGLTQQNVADVLGVDRSTYTCYELETTQPSPSTLYKLSQLYDVTVGFLMGVEKTNHVELKKDEPSTFIAQEDEKFACLKKEERELVSLFRVLGTDDKGGFLEGLRAKVRQIPSKII